MRSRSQSSRVWVSGGVIVALVIAAVAWFLVISPVRADTHGLREDAASVDTQNVVLAATVTKLQQQAKNKAQLATDLRQALNGLPPGTQLPVFSRQLAAQAVGRGVELTNISIATPTTPTTSTTSTTTSGSTPTATGASVLAIPVTVQSDGPALQQLYFLRDIQQLGPRLVLVNSTSLAAAGAATPTGGTETPDTTPVDAATIDADSTMIVQLTVFTNPLSRASRDQLAKVLGDDKS